jgi:anti-sigma B factor antagonist
MNSADVGCTVSWVDEGQGKACVRAVGEIDAATADLMEAAMVEAVPHAARSLVVDLGEVTFMDVAGLRVLMRARDAALRRGGDLVLDPVSRSVLRLLDAACVLDRFHIPRPPCRPA